MKVATLVVLLAAETARADHDHATIARTPSVTGSVGVVGGAYDSMFFDGDYQGVTAAADYVRRRFAVGASATAYRLQKNGKVVRGGGDTLVHGQVTLLERGHLRLGAVLGLMLPTGNDDDGLGMGHFMVMPAAVAQLAHGDWVVVATAGYGRGLGDEAIHAEHGGAWPLVEPMNYHEVTFGGYVSHSLATALRVGIRVAGAAALDDGDHRLTGGVRAVWIAGRVETAFELATGLVGDPFTLRGTLATAIQFD